MNILTSNGYSADTSAYTGSFSWWRSMATPGKYVVMSTERMFVEGSGIFWAVVDDFGNLHRVPV